MKKINITVLAFAGIIALNSCTAKPRVWTFGEY